MKYCNVLILDIIHSSIDRPFTYKIPEELSHKIDIGSLVNVYFKNQKVNGIVISLTNNLNGLDDAKVKKVSSVVIDETVITAELFELGSWMKEYYICPLSKILKIMLPRGLLLNYVSKYEYIVNFNYEDLRNAKIPGNAKKQKEIIEYLEGRSEEITLEDIKYNCNCTKEPVTRLQERGIIDLNKKVIYRNPINYNELPDYPVKSPTQEQKSVLEFIFRDIKETSGKNIKPVLIYGVTGSGKTEIYLHLIERMIREGKEVIVLIPEISLTPQTVSRFVGRFGRSVAVIHSRLSVGERYDEWLKVLRGEVNIVIGARSAVFAPFSNLGMIIIDEEHENAYKQEESPRYHAREVAKKRCELNKASLILGSATPSLESYYHVKKEDYEITKLKKRISDNKVNFKLVDMRKELEGGNKSIFSRHLVKGIKEAIDDNGRVLLFLNRRGYSTFVLCRSCGYVIRCPECEVSLTYHKKADYLRCHYCDYVEPLMAKCPTCKSKMIKSFGAGTERIEGEVKKYFPWLKTIRMDVDTTSRKGAHEEILDSFKNKEADVLIGTQMIAKGLDFPDISLVGVVSADTILNIPDFRAGEKTYQLLSQVAGRGGRGEKPGKVIIQTYTPEHYSIRAVLEGDYEKFADKELDGRKSLGYPPYKSMIKFEIKGPSENWIMKQGKLMFDIIEGIVSEINKTKSEQIEILGPYPCPFYRLRGDFRWHVIIKGSNLDDLKKRLFINNLDEFENKLSESERLIVDVDPISLL
ncbi:primosomal protein N' [Natranaerofaba carboxydovora]|uniref:primosomal protein N' n=1 Tax=Natranaerofaba carboxydovora TaxID=2742683 RepID=UPI001F12A72C|nr:primosomal protein N' [Natranaerofaba carboxydovora]UMZ73295.1 Primosomal protein N' [Natranaerofaba carboxydovora]